MTDLHTLFLTFDHTNVTGFSADPAVLLPFSDDINKFSVTGQVVFVKEFQIPHDFITTVIRNENYLIDGYIFYELATAANDLTIHEIKDELNSLMNVNNDLGNNTYNFEFLNYEYDGNIAVGHMPWQVEAKKKLVSAVT